MKLDENPLRYRPIQGGESVQENLKEVRLGHQEFIRPRPGYSLDCYKNGAFSLVSRPQILFQTTLLRVTELDLQELSYLPGAWALSIDATPTTNQASADYPGPDLISPLVAIVRFGTGAAAHEVEIDAIRNTIVMPAMDVNVDIGISQVAGLDGLGGQFGLFEEYKFQAVIHKVGSTSPIGRATRSYVCGKGNVILPVPNFAVDWCYVSQKPLAFEEVIVGGPTITYWNSTDPVAFNAVTEQIPEDITSNNSRNHCFREYHPGSKLIKIQTGPSGGPSDYPGTLVNHLEF